ncbi:MAG TPA: LPS assembly protein LptD [Thermoanaerobaculia bacterium]|nr:LPS assembly protein LptD [Thermoanaerobaculia bacterium]
MTRPPHRRLLPVLFLLLAAPLAAQQKSPLAKFRIIPGPKPGGGTVKITVGGENKVESEKEQYAILQGDVLIEYQDIKLRADKVTFNNKTKDVDAEGNVVIDQGPTRITASHAIYNLDTKTGTFFNAVGALDPTMYFSGDQIEKLDENTFTVTNGMFTSCDLDRPAWSFRIKQARVVRDDYAHMKGVSFRTRFAPLFWTPRLIWPTKSERSQGLLIPRLVLTGKFGQRLETAYFVPFGDSVDATVTTDLSTKAFWGAGVQIRYVPSENVKLGDFSAYAVRDPHPELYSSNPNATGSTVHWRYRYQHAQDNLPGGFRGVIDLEDFSDLDFFRQYERDPRIHTLSNVYSSAYLTKNTSRYSLNFLTDRREILLSTRNSRFQQLPSLQFRMYPQRIGPTPFYFSLESSSSHLMMAAFDRADNGTFKRTASTDYLRSDVFPTLSLQIRTPAWLSIKPQVSVRDTYYSASLAPGDNPASPATPNDANVNRFYGQGQVEVVGPSFSRIFNHSVGGFARFKHVIEPRVRYIYTSDVTNQDRIIRFDTVDTPFLPIVRDSVEYSLTQRLIGKEQAKDSPTGGSAREVMSFSLTQTVSMSKPFTNGSGGTPATGCTDCKFTPLVATLRVNPYQAITVDANATFGNVSHQIDQTSLSANLIGAGKNADKFLGLTWFATFRSPIETSTGTFQTTGSSQWRVNVGSFIIPERLRADILLNYDASRHEFLEQQYVLGWTGSCYGIALAPRRYQTYGPHGLVNNWGFGFSLSLKNVGTVGNAR